MAFMNTILAAAADTGSQSGQSSFQKIWDSVIHLWNGFLSDVPRIVGGIIILVLTIGVAKLCSRFAGGLLKHFRLKQSQRTLISRFLIILIWLLGILTTLTIIFPNLTPSKALAGLGLGSVAIGFAFKDIFENFFAGILILWRFPFENGDYICCQDIEGSLVEVTIRNTFIRRTSGELVVVPNSTIFKNPVQILTDEKLRRATIIAGVAYGEDVDQSRAVIEKAVKACETVSDEKPIQVFACEFADSSINFEVTWWTGPRPVDIRQSKDEVVTVVKRALDEAGIEIPFPYRTLTFKKPLEIDHAPSRHG